ncbi:Fasciclin-like arabinogalactan protein 19 [Morella rubra]|uniref:Fasciclin-like arabinogalactan protein 19 n=1 Tax=Morella rubra TaxID=262757 RepID=A0A6A1W8W9_9ROSI|nr:Fasciclin-like arabinogalactan protein 19 [Morella rubra]
MLYHADPSRSPTSALRHVVPRRLSFSDLCRHSSSSLPTLLPSCALRVTTRRTSPRPGQPTAHFNVSVDDVDVVLPGLYYGRYVAIHGLNSILSHRPQSPFPCGSQRPVLSSSRHSRFRRKPLQDASVSRRLLLRVNRTTTVSTIIPITDSPQQHYTTASPVPDVAATNRRVDIPLVNHTTAEDEVIHRYSPAESPRNSGNSTPEDHIPETHCSSILLEAGNGDNGDEFSGIMAGQILAVARENRGPQNTSWSPTTGPRQRQGGSSSAGPT